METSTTPLTPARVNTIVNDLLDSFIAQRKQSDEDMAKVTRSIARRRRVSVQQVAGVRAALTRGSYGDLAKLLRARKRAAAAS